MSLPSNGDYYLTNYKTGKTCGTEYGSTIEDTQVIQCQNSAATQWSCSIDGSSIILEAGSSGCIVTTSDGHQIGSSIIIENKTLSEPEFEIVEAETEKYKIKIKGKNLYLSVPDNDMGTPLELNSPGGNDVWIFS